MAIIITNANPFSGRSSVALIDRKSTINGALAIAKTYGPDAKRPYADETPCSRQAIDGRTVSTALAQGCTIAIMRGGSPVAWMWDEDAVLELDRANGDGDE